MTGDFFSWGNKRPFNSFSDYCKQTYGSRLQKLSINAGFTCPNLDGSLGASGCSFCNNHAFNPSYCYPEKSIIQQINEGIEFHKVRYKRTSKYIAYFQAHSNTYKPLDVLKQIYGEALSHPEILGISVGTRPDCVDNKKLDYLKKLSEKYYVAIEYGIESCYNKTLDSVNRGHSFEQSVEAIYKTAERGIFTTVHLLFGLPGESKEMMLEQADIISKLPVNCIKLHQLQILKNTLMGEDYLKNPKQYNLFSKEEYIDFIIRFLERLNPSIMIERLSAEVPPRFLMSSPWERLRADQITTQIEARMNALNTFQGRFYRA